ncbi:MAG TPA: hypothetical protein VGY66_29475 [Gemmataceae bacterium]|jgi:hypothetical protein|nr:hypothetical protein [Gemmataceae bacterium]
MPTKQQDEQYTTTTQEGAKRQGRITAIGAHVLQVLGKPGDLQGVQVRPLWQAHYRVNVLVGADITSVRVAHSFFMVADDEGNVLRSAPEITRQY